MSMVRRVCRNVNRWRSASMAMRWTAAAMQEAARGFRRLKAHKQLPTLRAALEAHHNKDSHGALLAKPSPLNINLGSDRFSMFNKKVGHPPDIAAARRAPAAMRFRHGLATPASLVHVAMNRIDGLNSPSLNSCRAIS